MFHLLQKIIWANSLLWAVFLPSGRSAEADGAFWAGMEVAVLITVSKVTSMGIVEGTLSAIFMSDLHV